MNKVGIDSAAHHQSPTQCRVRGHARTNCRQVSLSSARSKHLHCPWHSSCYDFRYRQERSVDNHEATKVRQMQKVLTPGSTAV